MSAIDVFGNIVDAETVESAVRDVLEAWIVPHLAHQERRRGLDPRTLPPPRSYPMMSDFDLDASDALPAVVIVSPGTTGTPLRDRGEYTILWQIDVAVTISGASERETRMLAAVYLAAIKGALIQNRSLTGQVEKCMYRGPDRHAYGTTEQGERRAIYGTTFEVAVRNAVSARLGPDAPPLDPYEPPAPTDFYPTEAIITVEDLEEM